MRNVFPILIVFSASLTGGYFAPDSGITLFFLLVVILFVAIRPEFQLRKDELLSLLFAFAGAASAVYAADTFGAILYSGSFVAGSIFYLVLRNSSGWESPLLKSIVAGGCIVGLAEALHQINVLPDGPFYNSNPFSGFITPLVSVAFYLYFKGRENIYLFASALLVFANFISASRAGIATMILALAAMLFYFSRLKDWAAAKRLLLVVFVGFCSFLLFSEAKDALMLKGIPGMLEKQPTAIIQRAYLLKTTLQVIRQAPLFGHGLDSFRAVMGTLSNPYLVTPSVHAHSLYLNILAEMGIIGLGLFLIFLAIIFKGPFCKTYILKVALLSFLLHNIVEYNFPPPPFQVLFYLLCAAIMQEKPATSGLIHVKGKAANIVAILLAAYFIVVNLFPIIGLMVLQRADAAIQKRDVARTLEYLFVASYFGYSVSLVHANTAHLVSDIYFSADAKDRELLRIAEKNYSKAIALNKLDGTLYIEVASFYNRIGRQDKAEAYLIEIIGKYPYHQEYRRAMARFCAGHGRFDEAAQILEASNAFLKEYAPLQPLRVGILLDLARVYREKGDPVRSDNLEAKARRLKSLL